MDSAAAFRAGPRRGGESRWAAAAAVLAVILLHLVLPKALIPGPRWLAPALESGLLIAVMVMNPTRITRESRDVRSLSLLLVAVVTAVNGLALGQLVRLLLSGRITTGRGLVIAAVGVWLTNVVVFALVFWEIDRGGPQARSLGREGRTDLLFPQDQQRDTTWSPSFVDYLYVSFTNSTAFSPTDTMPLTPRLKMAMLVESLLSFVTVGLVVARAVNILS